jgi:single-strand DNA-binding protein
MASYQITGTLVNKLNTEIINDRFKKREFALEVKDGAFTNFVGLQLTQDKCDMIDNYNIGDEIKVSFNVRGNKWEKNGVTRYITNLDAWRLEKAGNESNLADNNSMPDTAPPFMDSDPSSDDALPF